MANRAVKQPNGLYARFSDIVDHFTHIHLTREELIEIYVEEAGRNVALGKLERADQNLHRFQDEIDTIRWVHGPLEADRTAALLAAPLLRSGSVCE